MSRPRIVIVGAGFAGYHAARTLSRLSRGRAEIMLVNPTDYFLYLPLLPEVAAGVLEPRRVTVSLPETLPGRPAGPRRGRPDRPRRPARWAIGPEGDRGGCGYDRLVLAAGSVNKLLPIPGVTEHAHGFRGHPRGAVPARPHHPADRAGRPQPTTPAERAARTHLRRGRRRLHRHRGRRAGRALHRRPARPAPTAAAPGPGGCCSTWPSGCCPSWTSGCRAPPTGCCAPAASTCAPARRCRRRPPTACS